LLEADRGRAARSRLLVGNFRTLLDGGFLLVRGNDAGRGDDCRLRLRLSGRELQVHEEVVAENAEREAAGRIRDRQVDVITLWRGATGGNRDGKRTTRRR